MKKTLFPLLFLLAAAPAFSQFTVNNFWGYPIAVPSTSDNGKVYTYSTSTRRFSLTAAGSGTLTSITIAGTANNLAVSGTCTVTTTGTCTLSVPWATATTGTFTLANGKVFTVSNQLTFTGTDGSSVAFGTGGTVLYTAALIPTSPDESITIGNTGTAAPTLVLNASFTNALYDQTAVLTTRTAGATLITPPSATLEGLRVTCTTIPSAPTAGAIICGPAAGNVAHYFDGTNIRTLGFFTGSGTTPATIATGVVHTGSTYALTSSLIVAADITTATITPNKMAASTFDAQTDGSTVTWAIGSVLNAQGSLLFTTHGGSRTLNITGPVVGGNYVLRITQDGTGGEGLTLGSGCTWKVINGGSGAITTSTGAGAIDVLAFQYDGANCLATFGKNYN